MNKRMVGLLVLLGASAAFAIAEKGGTDLYSQTKVAQFVKGLYIGPDKGSNKAQGDTLNKITAERVGFVAWDFPVLSCAFNSTGLCCNETATPTVPGAKITDSCLPSSDLGVDGGSALRTQASLHCRAVTNGCVVKLCVPASTDGGLDSYDLHDAGFYCRLTSFQPQ